MITIRRGSVESALSMMKRKFGDGLRSKIDVAMANEALCKVLCHNLVVLIHEVCELCIGELTQSKVTNPHVIGFIVERHN